MSEKMTREQAINEIIDMADTLQIIRNSNKGIALQMAIAALKAKPKEGCWIPFDFPWFVCSECGAVRENKCFMERYCPNCGASLFREEDG